MRWILVDVLLALLALALLVVVGRTLWRQVRALGREVSRAGDLVAQATAALEQVQDDPPRSTAVGPHHGVPSHLSS